mgnify:FL=1
MIYHTLLSITLIFAAWRLYTIKSGDFDGKLSSKPSVYVALIVGGIIGFFSGVIGVGGGIFLSPIILLFGWSDPKTTAGVAAIFIWVNSAAGLVGSSVSGQVVIDFETLAPFAIAVLIGGYIGSKFGSERFSQNAVRYTLVSVMILAATKQIIDLFLLWF